MSTERNSSFWSPYHRWFRELGYPDCDIVEHVDGSWSIIQTYNDPVVPALCRWNYVLKDIRHQVPTFGLVERFMHQHDPLRAEYWEVQESKSQAIEKNHESIKRKRLDLVDRTAPFILRNPDLMDRIAKNGLQEMEMRNLSKRIPNHHFR